MSADVPALDGVLQDLEAALAAADPAQLPELLGALEQIRGRALARLTAPPATVDDALLTMAQVARRLSINISQARELGRRGELPTITVGERFVRVRASALAEWIRRREAGGKLREER